MNEWRELPKGDIVAFAEAVKAEDDIEVETVYGGWTKWRPDTGWSKSWTTRARSKPLHKPVFYIRKEKNSHIFHNRNGGVGFVSGDMIDERTAYLIELAIEEGKRQKAAEIRDALGVIK